MVNRLQLNVSCKVFKIGSNYANFGLREALYIIRYSCNLNQYIYNKSIIIILIKDFKIMETGKIFFIYDNSHYSNLLVIDNNIDKSIKHFTFRTIKDEFKNKTFIFRISNSFNNVFHSKLSTNLVIVTTRSEQFFIRWPFQSAYLVVSNI